MKKYYNITINLDENMDEIVFPIHFDEKMIKRVNLNNGVNNRLRVSIYYHIADMIIDQHMKSIKEAPSNNTILTKICNMLNKVERSDFDDDEDCAANCVEQGLLTNDVNLIRKGLFKAFVFIFEPEIGISNSFDPDNDLNNVLEFDHDTCIEKFMEISEKECYCGQFTINDLNGELLEEFYECSVYMYPYMGEMLLSNRNLDLLDYDYGFYGYLVDAASYHAAEMLFNQHKTLKSSFPEYYDDDPTPLESFWEMAYDIGQIDDDEYEEIINNINNPDHIELIYEIISELNLLVLEDFYRADISEKDDPRTLNFLDA